MKNNKIENPRIFEIVFTVIGFVIVTIIIPITACEVNSIIYAKRNNAMQRVFEKYPIQKNTSITE